MLFCSNSVHFSEIQLVCDIRTNGPTDRLTDGQIDTPSYRDARTHLKRDETRVTFRARDMARVAGEEWIGIKISSVHLHITKLINQ